VKRVGFVVHGGRERAVDASRELIRALREGGVSTRAIEDSVDADEVVTSDSFSKGLDLVVSVGGDGTFLRAAYLAAEGSCPVLGVKEGRVGFLTEVDPGGALALIEAALEGRARIEERLAVLATPEGTDWNEPQWGLNEVMVEKRARHRLIRLAVYIEGEYVTTFSGDGVIVAAPTGSTAYSFSAHGPIVSPALECLVITPVAAHMVFDRSFVLKPSEHVTLEVAGDEPGILSTDGRESLELPVGARVKVAAAKEPLRLVRRPDAESFYSRVRDKFGLPGGMRP
jgi:NAD+ kinase